MAPGPDFFYIPGEYGPGPGGVVWRPGFWARFQPGWEWIPARWDRWATGWVFREGFWSRTPNPTSPLPGMAPSTYGATLVSTPTGIGSPAPATTPNSVMPLDLTTVQNVGLNPSVGSSAAPGEMMIPTRSGQPGEIPLASRSATEASPADPARSGPGAGQTTQTSVSPKPSDSRSGPQPEYPQQPVYPSYGPQPVYYPGRAMMWNARSVVGFLRQFIP
jgi:hypothetical protein